MHTKLSKRGQVSIPSLIRKQLQIGTDTRLEWVIEGATVRVIPLPPDGISAYRGSGKKGLTKQLLRERAKDRKRENES
jgi:bifunctional DNA-binding transcriptional regulator/antitoxin component of YhaV-PrlF toxin-antitoxin module